MRSGTGLSIKGELTADEDITIAGVFDGSIEARGHRLLAADGARIKATINAASVTIQGNLEGHIDADRVAIEATADVQATVVAPHLTLADGARFTGTVNTERARAAGTIARHRQRSA